MPKVLVINGEPSVCDALADGFRFGLGAEVRLALTGQDGAAMIARDGFDLALIDGGLAGVGVFELAKLSADRDIPVILLSGDAETSLKFYRFGYQFLIMKSVLGWRRGAGSHPQVRERRPRR